MRMSVFAHAILAGFLSLLFAANLNQEAHAALGDNRLLIVTPAEFEDTLQPLVDLKETTGFGVTVLTLEQIHDFWSPGDTGRASPDEVKRTIRLLDSAYGIGYVMLVGDVNKFPVRWQLGHLVDYQVEGMTDPTIAFDQVFLPSDFYYADLYDSSGAYNDWDADGNGYFGEIYATDLNPDGMDFFPDVAVARIPAADESQLQTYIGKVIRYEFNDSSFWFDRAVLIQKGWSRAIDSKENIATHLGHYGFDTRRLYEDISAADYSGVIDGAPTSANISAWINVGAGFVSHLYHGQPDEWQTMYDISNIRSDLIRENRLSVVYSNACDTAQFFCDAIPYCDYRDVSGALQSSLAHGVNGDQPPPEPNAYQDTALNQLAIGEAFLVENDFGAVAYFGSMNTGEVDKGFYSHEHLEQAFFNSWTPDDNILGDMWADAVRTFATLNDLDSLTPGGWGETCMTHTPSRFILLGDPSLRVGGVADLLDKIPATVTDDYDGYWHNDNVWVTLTASDQGSPPLNISSGIERFWYTVDGGVERTAGNRVFIGAPSGHTLDGIHRIESQALDYCRNTPTPTVTEVKIDTAKPVTGIRIEGSYPATVVCPADSSGGFTCPEHGCYDEDVLVTLTARDDDSFAPDISGVSSTAYDYNGWPFEAYSGPFTISGFCGAHVEDIDFFSKDNAGNREVMQRETFCITSNGCLMDTGIRWDRVRILAAMEEIVALRVRDELAATLPSIDWISYEYALDGDNPQWKLIAADTDGKDGWGITWDTNAVQNGRYHVRLTVSSGGKAVLQEELKTLVSNRSPESYLFQLSSPQHADAGDLLSYKITFANNAQDSMSGLNVVCDLDPDNFDKIIPGDNGYLDQYGRPAWNKSQLAPGEQWVVQFTAQLKSGLEPGMFITSQASLSAEGLPLLISDDPASGDERDYTKIRINDKSGTISGLVLDYRYATPLPAEIVLTGTEVIKTTSDDKGYFAFADVQPGAYTIEVASTGYLYHVPASPLTINVDNQGTSHESNFFLKRSDARSPRSSFALTVDDIVQQELTLLSGTAADYEPGSGLAAVELNIRRNDDAMYWNGSTWSSTSAWLKSTGTSNWSYNFSAMPWDKNKSYTLMSKATDQAGNVEKPRGRSTTPRAPTLLFPVNGISLYHLTPTFDWSDEPSARYVLQVDDNADFLTPEIHKSYYHEVSRYMPTEPLPAGNYHWRVMAVSNTLAPQSPWSETGQVTLATLIDQDGDGIDDRWEMDYFHELTSARVNTDADIDGYSDFQEFMNQQSGAKDPSGNVFDPTMLNVPGGTGYNPSLIHRRYIPAILLPILGEAGLQDRALDLASPDLAVSGPKG